MASEKNFENKIKKYLKDNGAYFVKYFANRMTKVGIPDILACVNGYFMGIEVKAEKGTPSELQIYNIKQINEALGLGVIVRPSDFEKLKEIIDAFNDGDFMKAWRISHNINSKFI